jgi:low temperature requirement protein LtrA
MFSLIRSVRAWPSAAEERRASWLELFFDVGFVAAIAQLSSSLAHDYSFLSLLRFAFLLFLVWWAWLGQTLYTTRFDAEDGLQRLFILLQLFGVAAMAANAKGDLTSRDSAGFGAAYGAMRLILVAQYLRARRLPDARAVASGYALGLGIAAGLWILGSLLPLPLRFATWGLALLVDLGTPSLAARRGCRFAAHPQHLPERLGLFTLILLGEFVASVMRGMERQESWPPAAVAAAFLSLALAVAIWILYFDVLQAAEERHIAIVANHRRLWLNCHAHFALAWGIAVLGVGLEHTVAGLPASPSHGQELVVLVGSAILVGVSLALIYTTQRAIGSRPHDARDSGEQSSSAGGDSQSVGQAASA